jgi:hypothetical protein
MRIAGRMTEIRTMKGADVKRRSTRFELPSANNVPPRNEKNPAKIK